jgi:protein-S-isoprenylcysteine O-methyltransferase Ste14
MPIYVYIILVLAWFGWFSPFLLRRQSSGKPQQVNVRARWGITLEFVAFALLWQGRFWEREPQLWRLVIAILLLAAACLLSWTAVGALGRHWRMDAGLNADHQLVRSGPYAVVRHPIYTSMLCVLLGTGLIITPWVLFVAALIVFVAGTEIRVRTEDALLASRFGEEFTNYRRSVPAYIPWLRL